MQFLRTLFWVVIAAFVAIIASNNWSDITLNLWGNLQADIKIPVLLLITFTAGFLPTWLIMRGKLWRVRRRLSQEEVKAVPAAPTATPPPEEDGL
ncbi:lipopolysaccharide assembly protein LapA domain-containing protein [Sphingomonas alba]|uniref:Lipopolysaccharide assembly protein LapA domain-containing protein n=1 Tax=Sphingomonas alba TaxID=2908208 RepID=A0ABT0RPY9_9SPHN|nr:lipopolysaccharide assembly protein LapA domain-containing protein [Sphingomonas alba]MCL6684555.1 lipopolysaccharide assembly protein LapA domain-containing protein [Sphingomonas alba]